MTTKNRSKILVSPIYLTVSLIFILFFISSCYYDSKEYLFPELDTSCDTTSVTFLNSVTPVLQSYCYTCHSNSNAASLGNNIRLQNYSDVKISVDNGSLSGTINHLSGFTAMPKGGGKIPNCDILTIDMWINTGSKND